MANADETLRRAEDTFNRGDINGAERALAELWEDPTNAPPGVLHLLGAIRYQQRQFAKAEGYFRKAIKSSPQNAKHHAALGDVLANAKHYEHAVSAYREAMRLNPSLEGLRWSYGWACFQAGDFAEAEKMARLLQGEGHSPQAWHLLSSSLREQGKHKEALEAADQGLKLKPDHTECIHARAAALASLGREQEALDAFDIVLQRGAESETTAFYRAKALVNLKRYSDALQVVIDALKRWPNDQRLQAAASELRKKV